LREVREVEKVEGVELANQRLVNQPKAVGVRG